MFATLVLALSWNSFLSTDDLSISCSVCHEWKDVIEDHNSEYWAHVLENSWWRSFLPGDVELFHHSINTRKDYLKWKIAFQISKKKIEPVIYIQPLSPFNTFYKFRVFGKQNFPCSSHLPYPFCELKNGLCNLPSEKEIRRVIKSIGFDQQIPSEFPHCKAFTYSKENYLKILTEEMFRCYKQLLHNTSVCCQ
jgi:hypothetical protein